MTRRWLFVAVLFVAGCGTVEERFEAARRATGGDPWKGREAIGRYGCGACHTIPGVPEARANMGPPLTGVATRTYIAGVLSNTPENLFRWIVDPPAIDAKTAMPKIGVEGGCARYGGVSLYFAVSHAGSRGRLKTGLQVENLPHSYTESRSSFGSAQRSFGMMGAQPGRRGS